MNYKILLTKLYFCGIQGVSEGWLRSCLNNRREKVKVTSPNVTHTFFSEWGTLKDGVPQRSILGP
jgi:hypothetical protein